MLLRRSIICSTSSAEQSMEHILPATIMCYETRFRLLLVMLCWALNRCGKLFAGRRDLRQNEAECEQTSHGGHTTFVSHISYNTQPILLRECIQLPIQSHRTLYTRHRRVTMQGLHQFYAARFTQNHQGEFGNQSRKPVACRGKHLRQ
jgi:hypothetical protein